jgi:hypothetical protein
MGIVANLILHNYSSLRLPLDSLAFNNDEL